jgi:hypothetical protein
MRPEEAWIGLTPARVANAASDRHRPGWDQAAMRWGGADRTDAGFGEQGEHLRRPRRTTRPGSLVPGALRRNRTARRTHPP